MKTMILTLIFLFTASLNATVVGSVSKVVGSVKVKSEGSFKKSKVKPDQEIKEGDLVTTSRKGMAVIKLVDGSNVVLDKSSSIHFTANNSLDQQGGKVFYKITSRDAKNSLKIKTPFAIIGIKGTTFTVNAQKDNEYVALKEGLIGIASMKEQFKLYRKEILAKYKSFVEDQMSEYEKFKKGLTDPEPEVTKEFDLEAGNVVSFSDNVVKERKFKEENEAEFEAYEKMINEGFEKAKAESENIQSDDKSVVEN
jgi:molybdopterin synthase catalytic subunit